MMRHEAWRRADTPARIDFQLYPGESANMAFVCKDSAPNGSRLDPTATGATVVIDGKEHPAVLSTRPGTPRKKIEAHVPDPTAHATTEDFLVDVFSLDKEPGDRPPPIGVPPANPVDTIVDVVIPSAAITGPTTYTLLLTNGDQAKAFASGIITRSALVT